MKKKNLIYSFGILSFLLIVFYSCEKENQVLTVTDIDGNIYTTVTIGTQIWMVENLNTTRYRDGSDILNVTDNTEWSELTIGAYCNYDNDLNNANIYGALYNWYTVNTGNLCPTGWHIPSEGEWMVLISSLGGESVAGGKLKQIGTKYWEDPNNPATNEVGFNGLPGGYRNPYIGIFDEKETRGWWWTSSQGINYESNARINLIRNDESKILVSEANKRNGIYVRCIKD